MKSENFSTEARFVMLGGFLGAGKTTSVIRLSAYLQGLGKRVGIVTNDQAEGLVDTALAEEVDLPVREIAGGCFCCKSESLVEALERLEEEKQPDVFIAEPVGSCTDLMATVSLPLKHLYQKPFIYSPYSVIVDPYRAMQTLEIGYDEPVFSPDINYIYRKQLEEAEILVINKIDVVPEDRLIELRDALRREYPEARIFEVGSRDGIGMEPWFDVLLSQESDPRRLMDVDYSRYGQGEALLGWYNARVELLPTKTVEANQWLTKFVHRLHDSLKESQVEIAHLKTVLTNPATGALASMQLTSTAGAPAFTRRLDPGVALRHGAQLIVNLRAESDPECLRHCVRRALLADGESARTEIEREEAFRPGQPKPTHRVDSVPARV